MVKNECVKRLEKLQEEVGWLLSRAQLALDEVLKDVYRELHPAGEVDPVACSARVYDQPVKALKIFIGEFPPLGKVFAAPAYAREVSYAKIREYWVGLVAGALKRLTSQGVAVPSFHKAVVIFTFCFKDSLRRDPDRFQVKFILDALTWAGVLQDDSIDHTVVILRGVTGSSAAGTEILVADIYDEVTRFAEAIGGGNLAKLQRAPILPNL